jgi:chromate transport protein ChrA
VHNLVVVNGWATDREFANFFAVSRAMPGPNMMLMMSVVGWLWAVVQEQRLPLLLRSGHPA